MNGLRLKLINWCYDNMLFHAKPLPFIMKLFGEKKHQKTYKKTLTTTESYTPFNAQVLKPPQ